MITPGSIALPVAVVVERRPAVTRWADWTWRAVQVLESAPDIPPWSVLREEAGVTLFFAGRTEVWLHPTDTDNYKHNLEAAQPLVWVVLRPADAAPGLSLACVTVDGGEAHLYADSGSDLLESLPMPEFLRAPLAEFVARHHVERAFHKRKRDRADPEALARRAPAMDDE
ncbi:MAG TPA: DUF3305 domain-containing protein [Acetobacteraceae bacterium]|nr:DUF3305 domain-containing protein [Acetobacteraceae bacterium]